MAEQHKGEEIKGRVKEGCGDVTGDTASSVRVRSTEAVAVRRFSAT